MKCTDTIRINKLALYSGIDEWNKRKPKIKVKKKPEQEIKKTKSLFKLRPFCSTDLQFQSVIPSFLKNILSWVISATYAEDFRLSK